MLETCTVILPAFGIAFLLLTGTTRWFGLNVQQLVLLLTGSVTAAVYAYFLVLLPGTLVHELSHLVMARLLRVPTGRFLLRPRLGPNGVAQFGAVEVARSDPLRDSLIGLAPLLTGTALILVILHWRFGFVPGAFSAPMLLDRAGTVLASKDAAFWLYIVIAISNAMLPSASDRRPWRTLAIYLGLLLVPLGLSGALTAVPAPAVVRSLWALRAITFGFAASVLLDLVVGSVLWLLTQALSLMLGHRILYS